MARRAMRTRFSPGIADFIRSIYNRLREAGQVPQAIDELVKKNLQPEGFIPVFFPGQI
jgi:hypothetical protein